MSKAFTKEDDDAGFVLEPARASGPAGPFHVTRAAAKRLAQRRDAGDVEAAAWLARAETVDAGPAPEVAALGVTVVALRHDADGTSTRLRTTLVSAEEMALLGEGCSVRSPLGRALLGARVGDVREVTLAGQELELEVLALDGDDGGAGERHDG